MPFSSSSKKIELTKETLQSCFHLSQSDAAKKLGVSLSTLKRRFYEVYQNARWPYSFSEKVQAARKTSRSSMAQPLQSEPQLSRITKQPTHFPHKKMKMSIPKRNTRTPQISTYFQTPTTPSSVSDSPSMSPPATCSFKSTLSYITNHKQVNEKHFDVATWSFLQSAFGVQNL